MQVSLRRHSDRLALWTGDPDRISLRFPRDPRVAARALPRRSAEDPKVVLLLGANGFIGMHVLRELLADERVATVYALVRPQGGVSGEMRLARQVRKYEMTLRGRKKLCVLDGSFTQPRMGLDPTRYDELRAEVDAVIDATGATNHTYPYTRYRKEKLQPLLSLIEYCFQGRLKSLHIIGSIGSEVYQERRDFFRLSFFHCGYSKVKWVIKHLGLRAHSRGVPIHIYQTPFVLGGPHTGYRDPGMQYSFWHMMRYILQVGQIWQSDHTVPIVSGDVLARAVVDNMLSATPKSIVYPVTPVTTAEIADRFGLELVPWQQFRRELTLKFSFRLVDLDWARPLSSVRRRFRHALFARSLFPKALPTFLENIDVSAPPLTEAYPAGGRSVDIVVESAKRIGKLKWDVREMAASPTGTVGNNDKVA